PRPSRDAASPQAVFGVNHRIRHLPWVPRSCLRRMTRRLFPCCHWQDSAWRQPGPAMASGPDRRHASGGISKTITASETYVSQTLNQTFSANHDANCPHPEGLSPAPFARNAPGRKRPTGGVAEQMDCRTYWFHPDSEPAPGADGEASGAAEGPAGAEGADGSATDHSPATPLTPAAASSTPRAAPAAGRASVAPAAASSGAGAPRWRPVPSDGVPADADGTSLLSGLAVSVPFADGEAGA